MDSEQTLRRRIIDLYKHLTRNVDELFLKVFLHSLIHLAVNSKMLHHVTSAIRHIPSCYISGSQRPHHCCSHTNKVKTSTPAYLSIPNMTPKVFLPVEKSTGKSNIRFMGPQSPYSSGISIGSRPTDRH